MYKTYFVPTTADLAAAADLTTADLTTAEVTITLVIWQTAEVKLTRRQLYQVGLNLIFVTSMQATMFAVGSGGSQYNNQVGGNLC